MLGSAAACHYMVHDQTYRRVLLKHPPQRASATYRCSLLEAEVPICMDTFAPELLGNIIVKDVLQADASFLVCFLLKQALKAGKHVLLEKPATSTPEELDDLFLFGFSYASEVDLLRNRKDSFVPNK